MQNIALLTTSYPDDTPGVEAAGSFVEDFARELSTRARVFVVAAARRDATTTDASLIVRRFKVPRLPLSLLSAANPRDWPAIAATLRAGRRALTDLVEAERIDHILALWVLPSGWWARAIGATHNIAYSTWALGSDIWTLGRIPILRQLLSGVLNDASNRYADGLQLCADVEAISRLPCEFLPSSRRLDSPRGTSIASVPPYKLAFLGRWHANKGADLLMDALRLLDDADWARIRELRFFGGGPLEASIRAAARDLQHRGRPITIGNYLDKPDAAELIAWADYLLLPSRIESIPVIFSDAMQLGTPIIATPVGDLPRLLDRFACGVLATAADARSFAGAIRQALGLDASAFDSGVRKATQDFDLTKIVARFVGDIEGTRG